VAAVVCIFALAGQVPAAIQDAWAHDAWTGSEGSPTANLNAYGTAVTSASIPNGGSYADIGSIVKGLEGPPPSPKDTYYRGTTATLRAGVNTGAATAVSMAWRNRTDIEYSFVIGRKHHAPGTWPTGTWPTDPIYPNDGNQYPPLAYDSYNILSDVLNLTDVNGTYVLEMDYDETQLIYTNTGPGYDEESFGRAGRIYLGWLEPGPLGVLPTKVEWTLATAGNVGAGTNPVLNYQGSFDDFLSEYTFDAATHLDSYGVDIDDDTVWAVLDHTSAYAVVPEPVSLSLVAFGGVVLLGRRRR